MIDRHYYMKILSTLPFSAIQHLVAYALGTHNTFDYSNSFDLLITCSPKIFFSLLISSWIINCPM